MKVRGLMICVFLIFCLFGHIIEAKSFSKFDDSEIEKRLKTINKPAVKIIKSIDGERYGCVDFFKQPAFDHPSMKNHTYHYNMRPTRKGTSPTRKGTRETETNSTGFGHLWENGVGCPIGTVPIRRVTKKDLLRLDSLGDEHYPRGSWNTTSTNDVNKHHFAVARSIDERQRFSGATMDVCTAAPEVKPNQFSSARLHIQIGNDFIQAGLIVNPNLYTDYLPRIFVVTSSGGKSCYNDLCDVGIITVRQDIPLGAKGWPISKRGAKASYYVTFGVIKDQKNGNWWLEIGDKGDEVGFWPSSRFKESFGNKVEWGGEVYSASQPSPPMGYGNFPLGYMQYDAYIKRISVLHQDYVPDPRANFLEEYSDDNKAYRVKDSPMKILEYPDPGHLVYYGGPGGL